MQVQSEHTVVEEIATAVAEREGVDPVELRPPLASVVDPESLDRLVASAATDTVEDLEIRFTYQGHEVVVEADGSVELR